MVEVKHGFGATCRNPKLILLEGHCILLLAKRKSLVVEDVSAQRTRGAKEGFDREDPALAGFLNVPSGKTCSSDVLWDWGTLWEFLSCTYTASVHPSALHY